MQLIPGVDPQTGVSLADAVVLYGDLAQPRMHLADRSIIRLRARLGVDPSEFRRFDEFLEVEFSGQMRVIDKLKAGQLRVTALIRGAQPDQGAVEVHPHQWRVLVADFETSSATSPGISLDGILVFNGDVHETTSRRYGDKQQRAKKFITDHRDQLIGLSQNKAAGQIAAAVGCSPTHARSALKDEFGPESS